MPVLARPGSTFPGGAGRLFSQSVGVDQVFANGQLIVDCGEFTGERAGRILRSGIDTQTPSMVPAAQVIE
jgi:hypothetical protein